MRVIVTKPVAGTVNLRLEDRQGATGLVLSAKDVPVGDISATLAPLLAKWEERREAVRKARKGIVA